MVGHGVPYVPSTGDVISATVGLVYVNLQPEYELPTPSSTLFGQFRKFEKLKLGVRKNICTGSEFFIIATCASDLTFLALLTSKI